ncbi:unnamed protein product [Tetraodon nigroviridis]|uniref:(spotted green pufferfish) hypothetical protein n=1 Tax=Tetraodon nigroviridis TaxID=99883 RepID=Q4TB07_TETNG|nr:unnamed protein product [Tetraodon nigroviridis]
MAVTAVPGPDALPAPPAGSGVASTPGSAHSGLFQPVEEPTEEPAVVPAEEEQEPLSGPVLDQDQGQDRGSGFSSVKADFLGTTAPPPLRYLTTPTSTRASQGRELVVFFSLRVTQPAVLPGPVQPDLSGVPDPGEHLPGPAAAVPAGQPDGLQEPGDPELPAGQRGGQQPAEVRQGGALQRDGGRALRAGGVLLQRLQEAAHSDRHALAGHRASRSGRRL